MEAYHSEIQEPLKFILDIAVTCNGLISLKMLIYEVRKNKFKWILDGPERDLSKL